MVVTIRFTSAEAPVDRVTVELLDVRTGATRPVDGEIVKARKTVPENPELVMVTVDDDCPPATKLEGVGGDAETWNTPSTVIDTVAVRMRPVPLLAVTVIV